MKINNPFETYSRGMTARERRIRSRWALMFVISSLVAIWLMVKSSNQEGEIDELTNERDSLKSELFIRDTQLAREEQTLEILKVEDPKCAEKYETTKSSCTE